MANPVEITKDVGRSSDLRYGRTTVGASSVQVNALVTGLRHGVLLRTPGVSDATPNTSTVWVGDKNVTAATGMPMLPGTSLSIDVDDLSALYVISDAASQEVAWLGV